MNIIRQNVDIETFMRINYKPCVIGKDGQCTTCKDLQDPKFGITLYKGIGFWGGINFTYGTLCIWLPFVIMYITLPKYFKRNRKESIIDKKYFWYQFRPNSFGFYFAFGDSYGLRLPFFDIYLRNKKYE